MKNCWQDGDLRAFFDGEAESADAIAAHLTECAACSSRYRELSERATRISAMMAGLEYAVPSLSTRKLWVPAVLAFAAALAIAFLMLPKHRTVRPAPVARAIEAPMPQPVPVATRPAVVQHAVARRPQTVSEEFLRLDDDTIETGTLVRVSAEDGALVADLIVGPDGRAHAIRVVSNQ
jgi:hypothetical protein